MPEELETFHDEPEYVCCPACDHEQPNGMALMGVLGNRRHYRCRYCGMTWSCKDEV